MPRPTMYKRGKCVIHPMSPVRYCERCGTASEPGEDTCCELLDTRWMASNYDASISRRGSGTGIIG